MVSEEKTGGKKQAGCCFASPHVSQPFPKVKILRNDLESLVLILSQWNLSKYFEQAPWEIKRVVKKYAQMLLILQILVYPIGVQETAR